MASTSTGMPTKYSSETAGEELTENLKSDINGKVILTTGVSPGGLGAHFVEIIAQAQPKLLILAGRDASKLEATANKIATVTTGVATRILELDLGSQEKVRKAAAIVNDYEEAIDVLVNNAGIMATDYKTTVDGLESQFGTNHVGTWLFTNLIMDKLLSASNGARIVNVSSNGYRLSPIRFHDYDFHGGDSYNKWRAYGQAKTANMLMAVTLANKLGEKGLVALSIHPGVIHTNLSKHLDWAAEFPSLNGIDREMGNMEGWAKGFTYKTPSQGVATHIFAAFDPTLKEFNGRYLYDSHVPALEELYCHGISELDAEKLWKLTEKVVGQKFPY